MRSEGLRLYAPVFGSGLGHAYRMYIILNAAKGRGFHAVASSWGQGLGYLRLRGIDCIETLGIDVTWGSEGRMLFKKTLKGFPRVFASLYLQLRLEENIVSSLKPSILLSDSRLTPLLAGWRYGVPGILVINQVRLLMPHVDGPMREVVQSPPAQILGLLWSAAEKIIIPDLPPPYTLAEEQVKLVLPVKNKLVFVGFIVNLSRCRDLSAMPRGRRLAVFTISGPEGTKAMMIKKVIIAAKMLESMGWTSVISSGIAGGSTSPIRISSDVLLCEWCECLDELIERADVVVARSGHATLSKLALMGKPSVLLPIPFHGEQESNAMKAEKLGFAITIMRPDIISGRQIADAVSRVYHDERIHRNASRISKIAKGLNPIESTLDVLEGLL